MPYRDYCLCYLFKSIGGMKLTQPLKRFKVKVDSSDILPISLAAALGIILLESLVIAGLFQSYSYVISSRLKATLVQQTDGNTINALPKEAEFRNPVVVKKFVQDWVISMYTWSGKLPSADGKSSVRDLGIPVGEASNYVRVPTQAWLQSFLLPDDQRRPFLEALAKDWVPTNFFSYGNVQTRLNIDYISDPLVVDPVKGLWRVDVTAYFNVYDDSNPVGDVRYYRKSIYVVPCEDLATSSSAPSVPDDTTPPQIQSQLRQRGLQIKDIQPIKVN